MQSKKFSLLIIFMILLLTSIPAGAEEYDYQGLPLLESEDTVSISDDNADSSMDFSSFLDPDTIASVISSILVIILRLLGITIPGLS